MRININLGNQGKRISDFWYKKKPIPKPRKAAIRGKFLK
jgi:hypothetical protein